MKENGISFVKGFCIVYPACSADTVLKCAWIADELLALPSQMRPTHYKRRNCSVSFFDTKSRVHYLASKIRFMLDVNELLRKCRL